MHRYINRLSRERLFLNIAGRRVSMKEEQKFLRTQLLDIRKRRGVLLSAWSGETLIGISGVHCGKDARRHVGTFGISIAKEFRGVGVGRILATAVLDEARQHISGLRIIDLEVFALNIGARRLYRSLGFRQFGKLPKGVLYRGRAVDCVLMFLPVFSHVVRKNSIEIKHKV